MKPQAKNSLLPADAAGGEAKIIPLRTIPGSDAEAHAKAETRIITDLLADAVSDTLELKDYLSALIQQGRFTAPQEKYLKVTSRNRNLAPHITLARTCYRTTLDPEIRIRGRWLHEIGFNLDEYAKITSFHGMIIIFPVARLPIQ